MARQQKLQTHSGERIAVVSGLRTPFAKQATAFHGVSALDMGKMVVNEMMIRSGLDPKMIDQVVYGQVVLMPSAPNIAREIVRKHVNRGKISMFINIDEGDAKLEKMKLNKPMAIGY
ncbi:MAG: hypothetical protein MJK04_28090, partial [Psychrosphaera sp.]|nr:hypothetical protein [Psychrosphaera sp.]